ncbi:hypothetical protein F5Y12DRAFT_789613 [Xylaria sp. FL1777]|nr:hypothetical protein F5Y12DRAFT_789613 [Xylaria sp. FL1777]
MRRFDDRFARQNRCEPPPEFPLASPYPRIVHHLSGPNRSGLTPEHSHHCSTPWSVFQDGSLTTITPASLPEGAVLGPRKGIIRGAITLPRELRSPRLYPPTKTDAGLHLAKCTSENTG